MRKYERSCPIWQIVRICMKSNYSDEFPITSLSQFHLLSYLFETFGKVTNMTFLEESINYCLQGLWQHHGSMVPFCFALGFLLFLLFQKWHYEVSTTKKWQFCKSASTHTSISLTTNIITFHLWSSLLVCNPRFRKRKLGSGILLNLLLVSNFL